MKFINLPVAILMANGIAQAEILVTGSVLSESCVIIEESAAEKSLACNFKGQQIDDNTKLFIQNYISENDIKKIISVEATWTEIKE